MRRNWEEECDTIPYGQPLDDLEAGTAAYVASHRRQTESCPNCGMQNALTGTEAARGYVCSECLNENTS